jgi:hypothetical protein
MKDWLFKQERTPMSEALASAVPASPPPDVRVVLRRWKVSPGGVIALMPDVGSGPHGECMSFQKGGRREEVDYATVVANTRAVDLRDQEVVDLLEEMRGLGYQPRIILRYSRPA